MAVAAADTPPTQSSASDDFAQMHGARARLEGGGEPWIEAYEHSSNHRAEIEASGTVGCFFCCRSYSPSLIVEWIDDETTAMCPKCGIDSVIGDASGYPVASSDFLKRMKAVWF
jgi:hypothetical protein